MSNLQIYSSDEEFNAAPSVRRSRVSVWVFMVGLVALVVWAYFGRIDQVTRAPAQIIAEGRTQLIQSSDGGVLTQVHVK